MKPPKPDPHPSARKKRKAKSGVRALTAAEVAAIIRGAGVYGAKRTAIYNARNNPKPGQSSGGRPVY